VGETFGPKGDGIIGEQKDSIVRTFMDSPPHQLFFLSGGKIKKSERENYCFVIRGLVERILLKQSLINRIVSAD